MLNLIMNAIYLFNNESFLQFISISNNNFFPLQCGIYFSFEHWFYVKQFYTNFLKFCKPKQNPVKTIYNFQTAQVRKYSQMIKSIQGYSYKVNQHIGKGYSSTVHKGTNDKTGQDVSIKVIEMSKLEDPINQMLLQHQVSALKSLTSSANVLHLYDVYATKNNTYIITELMEGDLHSLLKQKKQFPYYEAVEILKQIIVGYCDIYNRGYLHRDIKPANVFYRKNQYKIGDFGFAIPIKESAEHKSYNVGSPVYMPPEALKQNAYSVSCDTWAIGVIFYQILKGLVPWRAISEQKLYDKILTEPLNQLTLGLPQAARTFLSRILHLQPSQRMKPQQLSTWPAKLFAVQIRQMNPSPFVVRNGGQIAPLQQVQNAGQNQNRSDTRSKSYSSSQLPNQVSGLRINLANINLQTNQIGQNSVLSPSVNNQNLNRALMNNTLASNTTNNQLTINKGQDNLNNGSRLNFKIGSNDFLIRSQAQNSQQKSVFNPSEGQKNSSSKSAEQYADSMISYVRFIHRVVKFMSSPTQVPLRDLQLSLSKFLFKEIQKMSKFCDLQNTQLLSDVNGWRDFVTSKVGEQKFVRRLNDLKQKYRMFCPLPKNQFVLQVYKEQLIDGIQKISNHLETQANYSDKALVSLDYLITFYQVWQLRDKTVSKSFKQFLQLSKIDKIMQGNPYNVQKQHLAQLRKKMKVLGFLNAYKDIGENKCLLPLNQNYSPYSLHAQIHQDLPQNKANMYERKIRY